MYFIYKRKLMNLDMESNESAIFKYGDCWVLDFKNKNIPDSTIEIVYPFGNFRDDESPKFTIAVNSPNQYYYTDLFGSFVLNINQAWKLYNHILEFQQPYDNQHIYPQDILSNLRVPPSEENLEEKFKEFYVKAYRKVVENIDVFDLNNLNEKKEEK